jgi:hypothetical protein
MKPLLKNKFFSLVIAAAVFATLLGSGIGLSGAPAVTSGYGSLERPGRASVLESGALAKLETISRPSVSVKHAVPADLVSAVPESQRITGVRFESDIETRQQATKLLRATTPRAPPALHPTTL